MWLSISRATMRLAEAITIDAVAAGVTFVSRHERRFTYGAGMTDPESLVAERIDKLLAELDPTTDPSSSAAASTTWGSRVHFPEGYGGLGLKPVFQRQVDARLYGAGAACPAPATSSA